MDKKVMAEHHKNAALHHEKASQCHHEAASHCAAGNHEQAAVEARFWMHIGTKTTINSDC